MNCRTHEHRHFERTLRSLDTVPRPLLAEGRFYIHDCPVRALLRTYVGTNLEVRSAIARKRLLKLELINFDSTRVSRERTAEFVRRFAPNAGCRVLASKSIDVKSESRS